MTVERNRKPSKPLRAPAKSGDSGSRLPPSDSRLVNYREGVRRPKEKLDPRATLPR